MKKDLSAMGLHLVAGIIIGYACFLLNAPVYSVVLAIVIGYALKTASPRLFAGTDASWWFANGGIIYVFTWLIAWLIFFNL